MVWKEQTSHVRVCRIFGSQDPIQTGVPSPPASAPTLLFLLCECLLGKIDCKMVTCLQRLATEALYLKTNLLWFLCFLCSLRLLTELETPSWWPFSAKFWKTPVEAKPRDSVSVAPCEPFGKEGVVIRVPAVVSQRTESHSKPGKLTVLVSGLEIHDSSSLLLHRFEKEDVDDIKVHSPYEVSIRQRFIGKPDVAYRLISAKMPEVIPILEVQFSKKIELLEDALVLRSRGRASPAEGGCSIRHAGEQPAGQCVHRLPKLELHSARCDLCSTCPSISSCWLQLAAVTGSNNPSRLPTYTCP